MVNIIRENGKFCKVGTRNTRGSCKILGVDKNIGIRVAAGEAGCIKEFESTTNPASNANIFFADRSACVLVHLRERLEVKATRTVYSSLIHDVSSPLSLSFSS
jgi:hypothetical protein